MVTFQLTLGPEGMDQLSSGLSSKAVSQDKPHFLRTGLLIFSSFLLTVTVCPRHHSVIPDSDSSSCPAGSQPWRKPWCPWFLHSLHLRHRNFFHSFFPFAPQTGAFMQCLPSLNWPVRSTTCLSHFQTVFLRCHNTLVRGKEFTLITKQSNHLLSTQSLNDN